MFRTVHRVRGLALAAALLACTGGGGRVPASLVVIDSVSETTLGDSLRVRVASRAVGDSLETVASVTNVSRRSMHLGWGACSLSPRLYRSAPRTGRPAFDWLGRPNPDPADGGAAWGGSAYLATRVLAAGETLAPSEFGVALPASRIAGDSLSPGRYYVGAWLRLRDTRSPGSAPEDTLTLRGGVVELRR